MLSRSVTQCNKDLIEMENTYIRPYGTATYLIHTERIVYLDDRVFRPTIRLTCEDAFIPKSKFAQNGRTLTNNLTPLVKI